LEEEGVSAGEIKTEYGEDEEGGSGAGEGAGDGEH
jgi:hypothetical protein